MSYFITIQYPYEYLTITLAHRKTIISEKTITKFQAIGLLIPTLQQILQDHNLSLTDLDCIGINTGPGPFNTLRGIIATANALAFAKNTPLIACNGLDLMLQKSPSNTIAILDAFSHDVYFGIQKSQEQGYCSVQHLVQKLNDLYKNQTIHCIGNGVIKHKNYIIEHFSGTVEFDDTILFASSQSLVNQTYTKYSNKEFAQELFPLYFASPVVKS